MSDNDLNNLKSIVWINPKIQLYKQIPGSGIDSVFTRDSQYQITSQILKIIKDRKLIRYELCKLPDSGHGNIVI